MNSKYYPKPHSSASRHWKMFVVMVLAFLVIPPVDQTTAGSTGIPQEAKVNQKKIDRDRAKKEKEAQKDYEKAVKRHMDNQSKETKAMMKKAKKDSKKNTPLK